MFAGLGLTLSALTACSEEPVCWDEDCSLCYDPLEQSHAPCPAPLTTHSCSHLPLPCRPFLCWPRQVVLQKVPSEDDPKVRNHGEGPY